MNYLRFIIILFFALAMSLPRAFSQNNFDVNRMNRDLNIMENILQEMFKTRHAQSGDTFVLNSGSLIRTGGIRGTYLPGFGVIFLIPDHRSSGFALLIGPNEEESSLSFVYKGDENSSTRVTEDSIADRIKEFLRDYGSTIGQLSPDDKVMVLYGAERDRLHRMAWVVSNGEREKKSEDEVNINTLSVVAAKRDLDAYRSGKLSADEFDEKVSVVKVNRDEEKHLDMEVLANIFETAFKDRQEKSFRIQGTVNHLLLDNFGALFFFDASYTEFANAVFLKATRAPRIFNLDASHERKTRVEIENKIKTAQKEEEMNEAEKQEEMKQAYSDFVTQLKEYLVDYGRTLSSVKSDQLVLLSVSLNSHYDGIPERIDIQVKKSVLAAMDRGSMSRDTALEQVTVTEY